MSTANTASHYGRVTKIFHWITALLIFAVIPLGLVANKLPYETSEQLAFKAQLFSIHKTLGVLIFFVACGRILWALMQRKPGPLHPDRKAETFLAELVHWLLYISLVAVPLSGWVHHAATTGFAPILLPIGQDLPLVPKSESLAATTSALHWLWSKIMVASILLHVAGALKHQIIDKDATLRRMWFGSGGLPEATAHKARLITPIAAATIFLAAAVGGNAAGLFSKHEDTIETETTALASVQSQWAVQSGSIDISITQLGSSVAGSFADWTAEITFDPEAEGTAGHVTTTIAIGSLTLGSVTGEAMGADFFDAEAFPTAAFDADLLRDENGYAADGTLTIKGTTVPVRFPFELALTGDEAVMTGSLTLDRRDFLIGQSMADETSVGFNVEVAIAVTATRNE
ncbi:cytochrome b/b6 domain-containing protein [Yoonia sp. BS5-3]|uniref:Cytochrome b/b6 domain-containing protein n=1 Tax=Yoonia phaeophyticola TaxID=3137369 RepID=A0ABZ2V2V8_9RHOB